MSKNELIILDRYHDGSVVAIPYGSDIITPEQKERNKKDIKVKKLRERDERGNFVIINLDYLQEKLEVVGYVGVGYVMMLLEFASYSKENSNYLPLGAETEPITFGKLTEVWGLKNDSVRKVVKRLVDAGLLMSTNHKLDCRKRVVHLSKNLVSKGDIPKFFESYTKVYQLQMKDMIRLISLKSDAIKACGVLAALLLKLDRSTQILLQKPNECDYKFDGESIDDFFGRLRIAGRNATTIKDMKALVKITVLDI